MDHRRIYPHDRVGRRHFGIEIQMSIDIRGRRNIAVAQPFLYFLQADPVGIKQTRTAMPLRYNKDKRKKPVFSRVSAFVVAYSIPFPTLIAFVSTVVFSLIGHMTVEQFAIKLLFCIAAGIMVWVASLPCIALIVVFNRNYIFSVLCSFLYAVMGFIITNATIRTAAPNVFMILPVNVINRWLLPFFQNLDTASYPFDIGPSSVSTIFCGIYLLIYAVAFGWIICNRFRKWDN